MAKIRVSFTLDIEHLPNAAARMLMERIFIRFPRRVPEWLVSWWNTNLYNNGYSKHMLILYDVSVGNITLEELTEDRKVLALDEVVDQMWYR